MTARYSEFAVPVNRPGSQPEATTRSREPDPRGDRRTRLEDVQREPDVGGRYRIAMTWWALGVMVEACIIRKCS